LKPSNTDRFNFNGWQELGNLAELLPRQPDLETQLIIIIAAFERIFTCVARLWLGDRYKMMVREEKLQNHDVSLSGNSKLMQQAHDTAKVARQKSRNPSTNKSSNVIAVPLLAEDTVLGVIELERQDQEGFIDQEVDLAYKLGLFSAIELDWRIQKSITAEQHDSIELFKSVIQLSKSITSILDMDNLINSAISTIYQRFGFSKVDILTIQNGSKPALLSKHITRQGIESNNLTQAENENAPVMWSLLHKEPVIVNDISLQTRFSPILFDNLTKSELVIPLISGDELLGVLDACSENKNTFSPQIVFSLKSLAENIAVAIRNAKIYHNEQIRRQVVERVQGSLGQISADTSMEISLSDLLAQLEKLLPCDASAVWLFENASQEDDSGQIITMAKLSSLHLAAADSSTEEPKVFNNINEIKDKLSLYDDDLTALQSDYPWISEIINSHHPVIKDSDSNIEPLGDMLEFPRDYSAIGLPLVVADRFLGMIIAIDRKPDIYNSDETLLIATTLATNASIGIENIRQYTSAHDQVWISTVLLQTIEAIRSATNVADLLAVGASIITDLAGANGCTNYLWDQPSEILYPQSSYGYDEQQQSRLNSWEIASNSTLLVDQLVRTNAPVVLSPDNTPAEIAESIFLTYDLSTDLLILFPMSIDDVLLGAVLVDFSNTAFNKNSPQKLWDDKYTLIQGITTQATVEIDSLQRVRSREEEAYISVALLQVAQAVVSLNQLDEILASIVRITPILVGVKRCLIYLWDAIEKVLRPSQQYGYSKADLQIVGRPIRLSEFPFVERIMDQNQIAYYQLEPQSSPSDWSEADQDNFHFIEGISSGTDETVTLKVDPKLLRENSRLLIGFPLAVKSEILGVMIIEEEDPTKGLPSYHIREKRIEIVNGITQQAAMAIKNELLQQEAVKSERMERELQLAREIQSTFLPDHLPLLNGWEMDARWQPAKEVGGDFYDILHIDDDHLGFVIADVADKGMPAALFMTLIRTLIRAAAKDNPSPASVIKQVNELLIPDSKHGMFVTVFYAIFDLNTGRVIYTNAGHNPPIVKYSKTDKLVELTRTSIALGLFEDIEVEQLEIELNPGDWILFYTDGVTEAFSPIGEMFGTKRLVDILTHQEKITPKEILDTIESSVHQFINGIDLSDDLTLAAIYRLSG